MQRRIDIPDSSNNLAFAAPRLCDMFSKYAVSLSAAMIARLAFGTVISALREGISQEHR